MICPYCLKEIPDNSTICPECKISIVFKDNPENPKSTQESVPNYPASPNYATQLEKMTALCKRMSFLLIILTIIVFYLAFSQFRKNNATESFDSTNRVLFVEISNNLEDDKLSDYTQIRNALENGGAMRLNLDNLDKTLDSKIDYYSAVDSNGHYWVLGALLNYIASEGWELVQSPTTGLSDQYYFVRK